MSSTEKTVEIMGVRKKTILSQGIEIRRAFKEEPSMMANEKVLIRLPIHLNSPQFSEVVPRQVFYHGGW